MKTLHPRRLALGAAIAFGLAAVIDLFVWTTTHENDWLYVAVVFVAAALLWVGVSFKLRTRRNENT
jgi:hypothetical protein